MKRIFLLGYMGVGKTSVGKKLASKLNTDFIDLDLFIENRFHQTISMLFDKYGENEFRKIETNVLKEVSDFENVIVSTGGGAPCFFDNIDFMNGHGTTIYLKASPEALTKRLTNGLSTRPLLVGKSKEDLEKYIKTNLERRELFYNKAQFVFETDEFSNIYSLDQSVDKLIMELKLNK